MPTVWISRPSARSETLIQTLTRLGITARSYPALCIAEATDDSAIRAYIENSGQFAVSIFVSLEASSRIAARLPAGVRLPALAIGRTTAAALSQHYYMAAATDTIGDSRQLLQLPLLQTALGSIAVLGGNDEANPIPSPLLCDTLTARGNTVTPVVCYRRVAAAINPSLINAGASGNIHAAVAYSGNTLRAMLAMTMPDNDWLKQLPLFVIHPNIKTTAEHLGFQQVMVAEENDMAETICRRLA